jgi:serine/threonine protein kinase/ankyrin repeat protein
MKDSEIREAIHSTNTMNSVSVVPKKNPFKFFDDPDAYEEEQHKQRRDMDPFAANVSMLPINIANGERIDISDLTKEKYLKPTKRRKMSSSDFEKRVEEGNLVLLDMLVSCKSEELVLEYLDDQIRNTFEVSKIFENKRTFLVYAVLKGMISIVTKIYELNESLISIEDSYKRLPIHYAVMYGYFEIVKFLTDKSTDLSHRDKYGMTVVHLAIRHRRKDIATYLCLRSDPNLMDMYGLNPLDYAEPHEFEYYENLKCVASPFGRIQTLGGHLGTSLFARKFGLMHRLKLIKPEDECPSFPECYTERDKVKDIKKMLEEQEEAYTEKIRMQSSENLLQGPMKLRSPTKLEGDFDEEKKEEVIDKAVVRRGTLMRGNTILELEPVMSSSRISHRDFMLNDIVGSGSFGEVYLVKFVHNNKFYAMKVYSKTKILKNGLMKFLYLEKRILINFDHPFLVKVHCTFQTLRKLYMVMDYCKNKDLGQLLQRLERIPEYQAKILIAEVVLAVEELHRRNVVHRDLKPDNILIDDEGHIKITDFGLSKDNLKSGHLTFTFCGSIAYLPPEVIKRIGHGKEADWYLVGELLYECIYGVPPFFNTSKKILINSILMDQVAFPTFVNRSSKDLMQRLLEKDPRKRLGSKYGAREVKEHPFFIGIDWEQIYHKKYKLFDASQLRTYDTQDYNQPIVDKGVLKATQKINNWSIMREEFDG